VLIYLETIGDRDASLKRSTEENIKEKANVEKLQKEIVGLKKHIADETEKHNKLIEEAQSK
jgi:uncharacterized protein YoxC